MENTQNAPVTEKKKISLSGIQPTGVMTLGNYIGAVRNWVKFQQEYDCIYMIANLHALTVRQDPAALKKSTIAAYALMLACGVDPERSIAFVQSQVPYHTELTWILNCYTQFGEMSRMTQFKDKSAKHADNINVGLFSYPVLMATDILLYQSDVVPVGDDQKQHLEVTRDIAERFNGIYGNVFTVPEAYIPPSGARIMSLVDPTKKMSKSDENPNAFVAVLDDKDTVIRKFKRAVTDSEAEIVYREGKDGINNLLTIYSAVTGKTIAEVEAEFAGKGYGDFKLAVGETVADHLRPAREKFNEYMADKAFLENAMRSGAERAAYIARKTMSKVNKKVGII
ncbi:MAG: tryptophan--tRNA ligase [Oscillospiraceae bacterium]|nr:tryptophan--tRNA ligase [Oscillospiraceae bacterium]MBQ9938670.1 tryptophan--tRNA ligase [Oscillospiraceae bacterium]